ncbi:MAG: hypothetical protein JWM25_1431, partial [Thermoleophilia bacterium]|nr:hypothetical protein [Thermoleophilia bacterium]
GDSGGPLVATDPNDGAADATPTAARTLIGVTSYNETEACGDSYGRFVRIANFASWLDGFLAVPVGAPSGLVAPKVTRVTLVGSRAAIKVAPTRGSVKTRVLVNQGGNASLELGMVPPAGGSIDLPASRTGLIKVHVRAIDARGDESASSPVRTVKTRVDRRGPIVAKFAARALAGGSWSFAWSRPVDTDRAVEYTIEKRRTGTSAWTPGTYGECAACWTSARGRFATKELVTGLVGKWQFRLTVFDRAGNATVKVAG